MNIISISRDKRFSSNYLPRNEAATYLNCPQWHIQTLLRAGKINAYRASGCKRFLYNVAELEQYKNYKPHHVDKTSQIDHSLEFLNMVKEVLENVAETNNQLSRVTDMITTTNNQIHAVVTMLLRITEGKDEKPDESNG